MDELKRKLRRTWSTFFSRFGKLREIQKLAIPFILEGRNAVIVSPTASGKTEAVLAPIVERALEEKWAPPFLFWIVPTRALVNDLYFRFEPLLTPFDLSFDRKTGDHPSFNEMAPKDIIITTPESFDSILSRFPKVFERVKVVVLDDVHLIDGTPRGDQMRVLLRRLRLINRDHSVYLLSATIASPEKLGERYTEEFEIVRSEEGRGIDFLLLREEKSVYKKIIEDFKRKDVRKALFFVNSRMEAERLRRLIEFPPFRGRVFVHHGSLSKREREDTEEFMQKERVGILVATTTLELGIDIGDIDAVVLVRPPHDIQSFLQRIGRGSRRRERILAYGIFRDAWEQMIFNIFYNDALNGILGEDVYEPSLSTMVQQMLSYIYQRRKVGTTVRNLLRVLNFMYDEYDIYLELDHLVETGFIKTIKEEIYAPDDRLVRAAERGWLHSNIDRKPREFRVVDVDTGRELGTIQLISPQFELGGNIWEVIHTDRYTAYVKKTRSVFKSAGKVFKGKAIFWDFRLGERIKARLFPTLQPNEYPFFKMGDRLIVFHLSGPVLGYIWQNVLRRKDIRVEDFEGRFMVVYEWNENPEYLLPEPHEVGKELEYTVGISKFLTLGYFFRYLKSDLHVKAVSQALRVGTFLERLRRIKWREVGISEFQAAMDVLLP